jgi:hypothetical protein
MPFVLLTACGGGAGTATSDSPAAQVVVTVPKPLASGTITRADSCFIADDASSCSVVLSYSTANSVAPTLKVGAAVVSSAASATSLSVTVGVATLTAVLTDGATVLDQKTVSGTCNARTTFSGGICKGPLLYPEIVYATGAAASYYPTRLTRNADGSFAVEKAVNKTKYQGTGNPLFNCVYKNLTLRSGLTAWNCQDDVTLARHVLVLNPVTNELSDYDDSEGVLSTINFGTLWPDWIDGQLIYMQNDIRSAFASGTQGTYFVERSGVPSVIFYQDRVTGSVIEVTRSIGPIKSLISFYSSGLIFVPLSQ